MKSRPRRGPRGRSREPACLRPAEALDAALAYRAALPAEPGTNVVRLVHGAADGLAGLVLERLGDVLVAQLHEGQARLDEHTLHALCATAAQRVGATSVYRKIYPKDRSRSLPVLSRLHSDPQPWVGAPAPPEFAVREAGVVFLVRAYDGYGTGLFLDHRAGRALLREAAAGRRVLNTFAYTCGHTVAAALGGAAHTVSVDASRKYLEWGKRNLLANGVPLERHRFMHSDVFEYFRRARRQGQRFDWVVLDPPTLGRAKGTRHTFAVATDLPRLVREAIALLDAEGIVQLSLNHRGTSRAALERVTSAAAAAHGRRAHVLERPALPPDFRGDAEYSKSLVVRID